MSKLKDNEFAVRCILHELASMAPQGATSELLRTALLWPQNYLDLASRIARGDDVEYRLNGAGLKLYAHNYRLRVGGDQAYMYPEFVEAANALFAKKGVGYE